LHKALTVSKTTPDKMLKFTFYISFELSQHLFQGTKVFFMFFILSNNKIRFIRRNSYKGQ